MRTTKALKKNNDIIVSVSLICYNQEDYITKAIDSVLMQEVDFKYEIVLSDDCSTDGTSDICLRYAKKYPNIIRLIKRDKNIGGVNNYIENYFLCKGKYVAFLEGDDFWIDPHKLQKQVDFLENNESYVICCSYVEIIDEHGKFCGRLSLDRKDTTTIRDLCKGDYIATATCMVRNKLIKDVPKGIFKFNGCDWSFDLLNAQYGMIKFLDETLAAYRIHPNGAWSKKSQKQKSRDTIKLVNMLDEMFDYKYTNEFQICKSYALDGRKGDRSLLYNVFLKTKKGILNDPLAVIKPTLLKKIVKYIFIKIYYATDISGYIGSSTSYLKDELRKLKINSSFDFSTDLLIVDDSFPSSLSGFRFFEFQSYIKHFSHTIVLISKPHDLFFTETSLDKAIDRYYIDNPEYHGVIKIMDDRLKINAKLAIMTFLHQAYSNIDFLEKNKIPFMFTLYPGGGFAIDNIESDAKLFRVIKSKFFTGLIVTQKITYDYILGKKLCPASKVKLIYGGVALDNKDCLTLGKKQRYYYDKDRLDVCFVARRYSERGADKGYDLFIGAAKELSKKIKNVHFHIVGNFDKNVIDISGIEDRVTFYGVQDYDWFREFYRDKDIIVSPNRPYVLGPGCFDGFPLTCVIDAMLNGVAPICCDELSQNKFYQNKKDMIIIKPTIEDITSHIEHYYNNPNLLMELGDAAMATTALKYSYEQQIIPRIEEIKCKMAKEIDVE